MFIFTVFFYREDAEGFLPLTAGVVIQLPETM
jgi:hypothetical protein